MTVRLAADKDTGVAVVTVDRPTRLNAIDLPTVGELNALWRELRFDDTVRAIVLTGAGGRAFSTGLDRDAVVPQRTHRAGRRVGRRDSLRGRHRRLPAHRRPGHGPGPVGGEGGGTRGGLGPGTASHRAGEPAGRGAGGAVRGTADVPTPDFGEPLHRAGTGILQALRSVDLRGAAQVPGVRALAVAVDVVRDGPVGAPGERSAVAVPLRAEAAPIA